MAQAAIGVLWILQHRLPVHPRELAFEQSRGTSGTFAVDRMRAITMMRTATFAPKLLGRNAVTLGAYAYVHVKPSSRVPRDSGWAGRAVR